MLLKYPLRRASQVLILGVTIGTVLLSTHHLLLETSTTHNLSTTQQEGIKIHNLAEAQSLFERGVALANRRVESDFRSDQVLRPDKTHFLLLATAWRSGSTFLGELLGNYPGAFYTFEPLVYFDKIKKNGNQTELLSKLFQCHVSEHFLWVASRTTMEFIAMKNARLWEICNNELGGSHILCFNQDFFNSVCSRFPVRVVKTVRLRVRDIETLLRHPTIGSTLKVVVLVRDPRGFMNSRAKEKWCELPDCADAATACTHLNDDLHAAKDLGVKYPGQIHLLRYEDLCLAPHKHVSALFAFIGLPLSERLKKYVDTHTVKRVGGKYDTRRNSSANAFRWRREIGGTLLREVEGVCQAAMEKAGYVRRASTAGRDIDLLEKKDDEIWNYTDGEAW